MHTIFENKLVMQKTKYFGPATVLDINEDEGLMLLNFDTIERDFKTWGRVAIPQPYNIAFGESVLVSGEDINEIYVIGVLKIKPDDQSSQIRLTLSNGAYASVNKTLESDKFQLRSKSGEMIFEYDPSTGVSSINVQSGDIDVATKQGDINFISEQSISFKSRQSVDIESQHGIRMATKNSIGQNISSMSLGNRKINLNSPELGIMAQRAAIQIDDSKYIGNKFSATFKYGKLIIGKFETIANDIISKARNVYKTVDELTQLKTGRMRTLVKSTLHIKAKKSYLKAEDDFKINANKIHLG